MIKPKRQIFKVGDIVPADYNPRKQKDKSKKGLTKTIKKFGYLQDIVINIRDGRNRIVGGHKRLEAMGLLVTEEIECTIVDLNDLNEKALNLALNNKHIEGENDPDKIEGILKELKLGFDDFGDLNFDDLFDEYFFDGDNPDKEWEGMPEFEQNDLKPAKSLIIHFETLENMNDFAKIIDQKLTEKTKSIWHPAAKYENVKDKGY
jgi:hypothetical protein